MNREQLKDLEILMSPLYDASFSANDLIIFKERLVKFLDQELEKQLMKIRQEIIEEITRSTYDYKGVDLDTILSLPSLVDKSDRIPSDRIVKAELEDPRNGIEDLKYY